jgi:hypothetical protein
MRCAERAIGGITALGAAVALLAGCGEGDGASSDAGTAPVTSPSIVSTVLRSPSLRPGQPIPTPTASPVLTLTGKIGVTNSGEALHLDVATIDAVGLRQVSLFEPWVKKTTSFQGVWLADLLKVAGVPRSAAVVHLTALDDYKVDLTMADVGAGGVFLATKTGDGRPIPISDGGPTRIVFVGDVPSGRSAGKWIWSLQSLDVQ